MGLSSCSACGCSVSVNAHFCPHCGEPRDPNFERGMEGLGDWYFRTSAFGKLVSLLSLVLGAVGGWRLMENSWPPLGAFLGAAVGFFIGVVIGEVLSRAAGSRPAPASSQSSTSTKPFYRSAGFILAMICTVLAAAAFVFTHFFFN